jgi:glutaminase
MQPSGDDVAVPYVSTGRLPSGHRIKALLEEAYELFKGNDQGACSRVYPVLAAVPRELFGICVVATNGAVHDVGDAGYECAAMGVSKPFVFALICQRLGPDEARAKLGVNSTGLPVDSVAALERSADGRTNAMVDPGAIATTSLAPGPSPDARRPMAVHSRRPVPIRRPDPARMDLFASKTALGWARSVASASS